MDVYKADRSALKEQVSIKRSLVDLGQGSIHRLESCGPVARFEDDHRRLGRPQAGIGVDLRIDRDPALPQPITLLPRGRARANRPRMLARQSNDGVRVLCWLLGLSVLT